jgi:N utilization substance protein B
MATQRDIRRLAFQALYQLDARGQTDRETIRKSMDDADGFSDRERDGAFETAWSAYQARSVADAAMEVLAPTWPAHRQAAVDRAILRLAHYEMTSGRTKPKIAVNEAVELAKEFSTEKSPAFINGLLDKILKRVEGRGGAETSDAAEPGERTDGTPPAAPEGPESDPA